MVSLVVGSGGFWLAGAGNNRQQGADQINLRGICTLCGGCTVQQVVWRAEAHWLATVFQLLLAFAWSVAMRASLHTPTVATVDMSFFPYGAMAFSFSLGLQTVAGWVKEERSPIWGCSAIGFGGGVDVGLSSMGFQWLELDDESRLTSAIIPRVLEPLS